MSRHSLSNHVWPAMGCGVGLRNKHYSFILSEWPAMDWFEAVTENFMDTGGKPLEVLRKIRSHYPVALHGVSLSIGSTDSLDLDYLKKLKNLAREIDPFVVSDHLCWTGVDGKNLHDLLPLPFTEEAMDHVVSRIGQVQDFLNRRILIENISTYVTFKHSAVSEWEFLREVSQRSGCGILLDLNNIYVNSVNHVFDPVKYLEAIPADRVGQFHLAGHTDKGAFLFDTHSAEVTGRVWDLYKKALQVYGPVSTLIEWDEAIPDFEKLSAEVKKAKDIYALTAKNQTVSLPAASNHCFSFDPSKNTKKVSLLQVQREIKERIVSGNSAAFDQVQLYPQGGASGEERMTVYAEAYVVRVMEALAEVYETIDHLMGREAFIDLTQRYIESHPSQSYNLNFIGRKMPEFIQKTPYPEKLPFLSDLAMLEWRVAEAFHSFENEIFDVSILQGYSEEDWEKIRIVFQPSVHVMTSQWPVLDIWNARHTPLNKISVDIENRPQNVLISRKGLDVICRPVEREQFELIQMIFAGYTLGEACEDLAQKNSDQELPLGQWFSEWMSEGLIYKAELKK